MLGRRLRRQITLLKAVADVGYLLQRHAACRRLMGMARSFNCRICARSSPRAAQHHVDGQVALAVGGGGVPFSEPLRKFATCCRGQAENAQLVLVDEDVDDLEGSPQSNCTFCRWGLCASPRRLVGQTAQRGNVGAGHAKLHREAHRGPFSSRVILARQAREVAVEQGDHLPAALSRSLALGQHDELGVVVGGELRSSGR